MEKYFESAPIYLIKSAFVLFFCAGFAYMGYQMYTLTSSPVVLAIVAIFVLVSLSTVLWPLARKALAGGSLEVKPGSTMAKAGESLDGNVFLTLSKPMEARGLSVSFYGERMVRHGKHSRIEHVCTTLVAVSGEKTYNTRETLPFSLAIPSTVSAYLAPITQAGVMGFLMQMSAPKIKWYVEAKLDIPNKFDVENRVELFFPAPLPGSSLK